jgi:multidrug efflux system membrane fusion protein
MRRSFIIAAGLAALSAGWVASGQLGDIQAENVAHKPPADLSQSDILPQVRVRLQKAEPLAIQRGVAVAEGDPLVRLAPEDRPARLAEAKALLEQRRIEHQAAEKLAEKGFRAGTQLAASLADLQSAERSIWKTRSSAHPSPALSTTAVWTWAISSRWATRSPAWSISTPSW